MDPFYTVTRDGYAIELDLGESTTLRILPGGAKRLAYKLIAEASYSNRQEATKEDILQDKDELYEKYLREYICLSAPGGEASLPELCALYLAHKDRALAADPMLVLRSKELLMGAILAMLNLANTRNP